MCVRNSKRIIAVYRGYAHKKAATSVSKGLVNKGYEVKLLSLPEVNLYQIATDILSLYDVVILSCGGRDINLIIKSLASAPNSPKTISLFPGIVAPHQLDAFITRLPCDHVLLNSENDEIIYRKVCKAFKMDYNGILFGAAWFDFTSKDRNVNNNSPQCTVFFEQTNVPYLNSDRYDLAKKLVTLSKNNTNRKFLIKERKNEKSTNLVSIASAIENLDPPINLEIVNDNISNLLIKSDSCMTVSSSAALEWILSNKNAYVISDYMKANNYSGFFSGSGLLIKINKIRFNNPIYTKRDWYIRNASNPNNNIHKLTRKIEEPLKKTSRIFLPNEGIWKILIKFPLLLITSPRILKRRVTNSVSIVCEAHE